MVIHKSELADLINKLAGKKVVENALVGSPTKNQIQIVLKEEEVAAETKEKSEKETEKESVKPAAEDSEGKDEKPVKKAEDSKTKPRAKGSSKTKKAD